MAYESEEHFILDNGVYVSYVYNGYNEVPEITNAVWHASTFLTNGYDEDSVDTHTPVKKEIGFIDDWKVDHYGNRYAEKIILWEPVNGEGLNKWERIDGKE